jgi:hypothetical protein
VLVEALVAEVALKLSTKAVLRRIAGRDVADRGIKVLGVEGHHHYVRRLRRVVRSSDGSDRQSIGGYQQHPRGRGSVQPRKRDNSEPLANGSGNAIQVCCSYGPRLLFLVVSPWAKENFVEHSVIDQISALRCIEENWGPAGLEADRQTSWPDLSAICSILTAIGETTPARSWFSTRY